MRLNLFIPFTGQRRGLLRRILRALGPSWSSSPLRRAVQALCLALFLVLLFYVCRHEGPNYADAFRGREILDAEAFVALDPLVSLSASLAGRAWVWSLTWAGAILLVCILVPRGFCGYLCPLGSLIDLFDWAVGKRLRRFRIRRRGWWVHLKYYILTGILAASVGGMLLGGFLAALAVLTRGLVYGLGPLQLGLTRGWYLVPPLHAEHYLAIGLLLGVFGLGVLGPRFWCRYVCPTGAVFSAAGVLRLTGRTVGPECTACDRCVEACSFEAIRTDYSTRTADCALCQTCGGVCPAHAIEFAGRWNRGAREQGLPAGAPGSAAPALESPLSRRAFLAGGAGGLAIALGVPRVWGAGLACASVDLPIRPPGSAPEKDFLRLCVRCGQCLKACPTGVLQPMGFRQGLEGLWTPRAVCDWSGCDPRCNLCGQVCPTGAIRSLDLEEKRAARMGLAAVNPRTCLPHAGDQPCQLCVDQCAMAGYNAIEFVRVHVQLDDRGAPIDDSGFLAPVVLPGKCVGCGLCQSRCFSINVHETHVLDGSAIVVQAGPGKEDRIRRGSYRALREAEQNTGVRQRGAPTTQKGGTEYVPDFLR